VIALKRELTDVSRLWKSSSRSAVAAAAADMMIKQDEIKKLRDMSYPPKKGRDLFEE
jgi:hypothetical protein